MPQTKIVLFFFLVSQAFAASAAPTEQDCFNAYKLSNHERAVEPGIIVSATDGVPEHCAVRGVINRAIRFEVRLPTKDWSGRFLMEGTGGASGFIADTTRELHRGFAVASTDTGHEGQDPTYAMQPEAALDYAFRGVHLATLTAKDVTRAFYDQEVDHAYYRGCSNGGRQGLIEATRYPDDFDGIVVGAPAIQVIREFLLWSLNVHRAQEANPLTEAHLSLLDQTSSAACDSLDGVNDGVINDPRECTLEHYDPTSLLCSDDTQGTCLTEGQLETVMTHLRGVVDAGGNVISPGLLPGAEGAGDWRTWGLPGMPMPITGEALDGTLNEVVTEMLKTWVYRDLNYDPNEFDMLNDRADLERASAIVDVNTADLSEFSGHGGKILMYQGWNDYPLRAQRAIEYLHKVEAESGGVSKTKDFFRLFMIPGMTHCGRGPGAWVTDYIDPLVQWVEENKAPDTIIGSRPDGAFSRPQCVYPKLAQYDKGPEDQASSYVCK
ncbi:MAG: tannase/feruloyl esterase family alpha/beta hydrolase [Pseudomonadales bacterium]|nr:tannase/feruloyl esterase family alpha/beta hydrolase [Pseudomonadales bacterium]